MSYNIVRHYFNRPGRREVIATGLSLDEARAHCRDPNTSSSTCWTTSALARTRRCGPWFDGYEEACYR